MRERHRPPERAKPASSPRSPQSAVGHTDVERLGQPGADHLEPVGRLHRTAHWIAEVLYPPYLAVGTLFFVSIRSSSSLWAALGWGLLTSLFSAVLPYAVLLIGVRLGHFGDRQLHQRKERLVPMLLALVSVVAGLGVVDLLGAPRPVVATVAALLAGLLVVLMLTAAWKVSVHLAVATGIVAILFSQIGLWVALTLPLLAVLAWARVHTRSHTLGQVVAGTAVGGIVVAAVNTVLLRWGG